MISEIPSTARRLASSPGIEMVNPLEIPDWDDRVAAFPSATIFHTAAWLRVLVDTYGFEPCFFVQKSAAVDRKPEVAVQGSDIRRQISDVGTPPSARRPLASALHPPSSAYRAILPLVEVDSWLTGRRGVGLPFTDECPPLAPDSDTVAALFEAAAEFGRSRKWKSLELRGANDCFPTAPASTTFFGHEIDLTGGDSAALARFDSSTRRAVRKAEAAGVTIASSATTEAISAYYELHCGTRRRHGQPPQPVEFFQQIQRHLLAAGLGKVVLARHGKEPVAGAVFFNFRGCALYKFGASSMAHQNLRANDLLFSHAIGDFARAGCGSLDLGRTSLSNTGLRQFKLKWGATERPVSYLKYEPTRRQWLQAADESGGLHTRVFRIMPRAFGNLVGRALYRHIA